MLDHLTFHPESVLLSRLRNAADKRQVVVLAGSALTMPVGGIPGVPTTAGIVDMIRAEFADEKEACQALEHALATTDNPYQKGFEMLSAYRGTSVVNRVIRQAVLAARRPGAPRPPDAVFDDMHRDYRAACQELERDAQGWALSPGVEALGRLAAHHKRFGQTILTTNFDPLVEIAITRAHGDWYRLDMGSDGSLGQAHGKGARVVHLHGHWYGALTLHTPAQLLQPRPQLEASLRRLLDRDCLLLVLAYSGWDDVLTRALAAVLHDIEATPEVLWTFYQDDVARIRLESEKLLRDLGIGSGTSRVTLFRGIDVHRFLPRLADALVPTQFGVLKGDMKVAREAELSRLLAAMFSTEELRRWVHLTFGQLVGAQLPGFGTSLSQLVFELTLVLQRHDLIDARLFESLVQERPGRLADIAAIARQWSLDLYAGTSRSLRAQVTPERMPASRLTCLFSPTDQIFWDKLMKHLSPLVQRGELSGAQGMGLPASRNEDFLVLTSFLRSATEDADVVVFLMSADLLGSDYAAPAVLEAALDRVAVLTVIVRPCLWTESWLSGFPILPHGGSTMTTASNEDEAWLEVVQAISALLKAPRATAGELDVALDINIADEPAPKDVVSASAVFGTTSMPTHTLVETQQFERLRYEMAVPRRLLVVEGPSGIGKTVAVKHVVNGMTRDVGPAWPLVRLNAKEPMDLEKIDKLLQQPATALRGYTIIDEFHNLDPTRKQRLASCAKVLADQDGQEAKLVFVGIPRVRESILADVPDLHGRMVVVRLGRVDVACIQELIEKGEQALNVSLTHKAELAAASEGSFVIAQQLCEAAIVKAHVWTTAQKRATLRFDLRALLPELLDGLSAQFYASLQAFSMQPGVPIARAAALALLWHLRNSDDGSLQIAYVRARYLELDHGFDVLLQHLADAGYVGMARWREIFYCDPAGGYIALEDPKLHFYLKHLNWKQLGLDCGLVFHVSDDSGNMIFPATSWGQLVQASVAVAPSLHPPPAAGRNDAARRGPHVRVLHLSDFHFNTGTSWDSATVLGRLAVDIKGLVRKGLAPDLIVLTGDIAQGGKPEEYDLARSWILRELLPAAEIDVTRLIIVPGNHDVDRQLISRSAQHLAAGIRNARSQKDVVDVLGGADRHMLLRRLDAYVAFLNSLGVTQTPLERPWYRTTHEIRGVRVHCAALASAWLSTDHQDYGQLLLGLWQCNEVLYGADDAHVVLAAMHHPWDYIAEWDRVAAQAEIERSAGMILRGHLHDERYLYGQSPRHGGVLELAAGACYETSQVANSYHLMEILPAPSGEHRVRIHPRRWEPARREWQPDLNVFGGPFGELPVRMRSATGH